MQDGRAALLGKGPPVNYVQSASGTQQIPAGMHIEYVPLSSLHSAPHTQPETTIAATHTRANSKLAGHWTYIPDAVLAPAMHSHAAAASSTHTGQLAAGARNRRFVTLDDDKAEEEEAEIAEDPSLEINVADEDSSVADPFSGERSCGISSLVQQSMAIFPRWDNCGYLMSDKVGQPGFIAPPEDDLECTPKMMEKAPCNKATLRSLKSGSISGLRQCMQGIKGLSQTCETFSKCGPIASGGPFAGRRSSVCFAAEGDFYKEAAVERMCGICGMFHGEDGATAVTAEDTRVASTWLGTVVTSIQHLF